MGVQLQQLMRQIQALQRELESPDAFLRPIGEAVVEQTEQRFKTKLDPMGQTWKPWSASYRKTRKAQDSLLIDMSTHRGGPHLKDSIEIQYGRNLVEVGTNVEYSVPNQRTRPFLGIGPADVPGITAAVQQEFEAMITRAAGVK